MNPTVIDELLRGSVDLHMHAGPDLPHEPRLARRVDALEAATLAREAGQRAIVLKSHQYLTAPLATIVSKVVPGIRVLGAVALNHPMGGLNPQVVELAGQLGAKLVWFPTISSAHHHRAIGSQEPGLTIFQDGVHLHPVVYEILDLIKQHDMVLCTGHLSPQEALALVAEARRRGLERIIATHPFSKLYSRYNEEQVRQLADMGALVEFTLIALMPTFGTESPSEVVERIRALGPQRCLISTDFGQMFHPPPAEGMRLFIATLLARGLAPEEIQLLCQSNPAQVVGLD